MIAVRIRPLTSHCHQRMQKEQEQAYYERPRASDIPSAYVLVCRYYIVRTRRSDCAQPLVRQP